MNFTTTVLSNLPSGPDYMEYRMFVLRQIQAATAGHWNINHSEGSITTVHDLSPEQMLIYFNTALVTFCKENVLPYDIDTMQIKGLTI